MTPSHFRDSGLGIQAGSVTLSGVLGMWGTGAIESCKFLLMLVKRTQLRHFIPQLEDMGGTTRKLVGTVN